MSWGESKKIIMDLTDVFTQEIESVRNDVKNVRDDVSTIPKTIVKSVQRGITAMNESKNKAVIITAVNTAKAFVNVQPFALRNDQGAPEATNCIGRLTSSTTITVYSTSVNGSSPPYVMWEVIEYY